MATGVLGCHIAKAIIVSDIVFYDPIGGVIVKAPHKPFACKTDFTIAVTVKMKIAVNKIPAII